MTVLLWKHDRRPTCSNFALQDMLYTTTQQTDDTNGRRTNGLRHKQNSIVYLTFCSQPTRINYQVPLFIAYYIFCQDPIYLENRFRSQLVGTSYETGHEWRNGIEHFNHSNTFIRITYKYVAEFGSFCCLKKLTQLRYGFLSRNN